MCNCFPTPVHTVEHVGLCVVLFRYLNADNEMRRKFGSRVVQAEQGYGPVVVCLFVCLLVSVPLLPHTCVYWHTSRFSVVVYHVCLLAFLYYPRPVHIVIHPGSVFCLWRVCLLEFLCFPTPVCIVIHRDLVFFLYHVCLLAFLCFPTPVHIVIHPSSVLIL